MIESRNLLSKSRIPVRKGGSIHDKENVLSFANKKGNVTSNINQSSNRNKTQPGYSNHGKLQSKQAESRAVRSAPNFEKLHRKWKSNLAKKKATTKRPNTKIEPFNLTKTPVKKNEDDDSEGKSTTCDHEDGVSPKRSSNETSADFVQDTCLRGVRGDHISGNTIKKTPVNVHEFKVPQSRSRQNNVSSVKRKTDRNYQDLFDFKPDNAALESILNNVGVVEMKTQATKNKRNTASFCSPSPLKQKRFSVYYTGPHPDRPLSGFGQRLLSRRASAMNEVRKSQIAASPSLKHFEPSRTLIGIQEMQSRFTTTPQKDQPRNVAADHSNGAILNEVSWADTLKYYSQFSSNARPTPEQPCDEPQDAEALIAQLEDEVYRSISEVKLVDEYVDSPTGLKSVTGYSPTCSVMNSEFSRNYNVHSSRSYPLQVCREKTPVFRQLFASPSCDAALEDRESRVQDCEAWRATKMTFTENILENLRDTSARHKENLFESEPMSYDGPVPSHTFQEPNILKANNVLAPPSSSISSPSLFSRDVEQSYKPAYGVSNRLPISALSAFNSSIYGQKSTSSSFNQTIYGKRSDVPRIPLETANLKGHSGFSTQHVNGLSAFKTVRSLNTTTNDEILGINVESERSGTKIIVPTPQRPVFGKTLSADKLNSNETGPSGFFTRHRQIMRDALVKSRDRAQEILLDAEVSLYARNFEYLQKYRVSNKRLENPVAKLFLEGDDMHFSPVCE